MPRPPAADLRISIHALREEGDAHAPRRPLGMGISIHALREEGDRGGGDAVKILYISIHALREEGDMPLVSHKKIMVEFLSTPSARRATNTVTDEEGQTSISIHALREEGDMAEAAELEAENISIHALREEGDLAGLGSGDEVLDFYPRPPRGGRQQKQRQNLYLQTNYTTFCTNLEEL